MEKSKLEKNIKSILTDVELPMQSNIGTETSGNNCGPLSILMLIKTDFKDKINNIKLEDIIKGVQKNGKMNTQPGFICKYLEDVGYKVNYYSTIEWDKCIFDPITSINKWDVRLQQLVKVPWVDKKAMQDSAIWLLNNSNHQNILIKNNIDLRSISKALNEGKRIIAIVDNGQHYIVVTGIDEHNIYFNDPDNSRLGSKKSISQEEFLKYWGSNLGLSETIICEKK